MKRLLLLISILVCFPVNAQTLEHRTELPEKPVSQIAYLGQCIPAGKSPTGEGMPFFPSDLVITETKCDGKDGWLVKKLNTCSWCGAPMTFKQAMFDKKSSTMWIIVTALEITDVELSHHAPCFVAHTCKEGNPLLGQTRAQAYSVMAALDVLELVGQGDARRGSVKDHVGGWRYWWVIPSMRYVQSSIGIIANLSRWHK